MIPSYFPTNAPSSSPTFILQSGKFMDIYVYFNDSELNFLSASLISLASVFNEGVLSTYQNVTGLSPYYSDKSTQTGLEWKHAGIENLNFCVIFSIKLPSINGSDCDGYEYYFNGAQVITISIIFCFRWTEGMSDF